MANVKRTWLFVGSCGRMDPCLRTGSQLRQESVYFRLCSSVRRYSSNRSPYHPIAGEEVEKLLWPSLSVFRASQGTRIQVIGDHLRKYPPPIGCADLYKPPARRSHQHTLRPCHQVDEENRVLRLAPRPGKSAICPRMCTHGQYRKYNAQPYATAVHYPHIAS